MATTNLKQWNPTAANQETDAEYAADSQRSGGAVNPSLFQAELANKLFYQMSTYLTALFTAFANKGFSTSDSSLSTLTAQCANFITSSDVKPFPITIPFASSLTLNAALSSGFVITLTGNVTNVTVSNTPSGLITIVWLQNGAGGHTVTYGSQFVTPGLISTTANARSTQTFIQLPSSGLLIPVTPTVVC